MHVSTCVEHRTTYMAWNSHVALLFQTEPGYIMQPETAALLQFVTPQPLVLAANLRTGGYYVKYPYYSGPVC